MYYIRTPYLRHNNSCNTTDLPDQKEYSDEEVIISNKTWYFSCYHFSIIQNITQVLDIGL